MGAAARSTARIDYVTIRLRPSCLAESTFSLTRSMSDARVSLPRSSAAPPLRVTSIFLPAVVVEGRPAMTPDALGPGMEAEGARNIGRRQNEVSTTSSRTEEGERSMKLAVELPEDIAKRLEEKSGDPSQAAREAIAIEGYRSGALSQNQVQHLLGLPSRWEVDAILERAGVYLEYTEEDLDRELATCRELTNR
jgi:predicted HTH domain antitoxin